MFKKKYTIDKISFSSINEYINNISDELLLYIPIKLYRRHMNSLIQVGIPYIDRKEKVEKMIEKIPSPVINTFAKWLSSLGDGKLLIWIIAESNNPTSATRININSGKIEIIIT